MINYSKEQNALRPIARTFKRGVKNGSLLLRSGGTGEFKIRKQRKLT